jgi:hypothetical protein
MQTLYQPFVKLGNFVDCYDPQLKEWRVAKVDSVSYGLLFGGVNVRYIP